MPSNRFGRREVAAPAPSRAVTRTVYCTNDECRNNVGGWPVRAIRATRERGFDFYALKDAAMTADAECGFMLWDGQSRGTLANVRRLVDPGRIPAEGEPGLGHAEARATRPSWRS